LVLDVDDLGRQAQRQAARPKLPSKRVSAEYPAWALVWQRPQGRDGRQRRELRGALRLLSCERADNPAGDWGDWLHAWQNSNARCGGDPGKKGYVVWSVDTVTVVRGPPVLIPRDHVKHPAAGISIVVAEHTESLLGLAGEDVAGRIRDATPVFTVEAPPAIADRLFRGPPVRGEGPPVLGLRWLSPAALASCTNVAFIVEVPPAGGAHEGSSSSSRSSSSS